MGKKKIDWYYTGGGNQHGLMVCNRCQKKIVGVQYRVYDAGEAYVVQHRTCSLEDKMWAKLEGEMRQRIVDLQADLVEYQAFRAKHSENALDEVIELMEERIEYLLEQERKQAN